MKYTRLDLKKKNKNNPFFILVLLGILALAFVSGTAISKLFINNSNQVVAEKSLSKDTEDKLPLKTTEQINEFKEINEFVIIQCGVFTSKENAEALKNKLEPIKEPFIIQEENKSRVILGIFSKENLDLIIKKLTENKVEFSKINIKIDDRDLCNIQIAEIIDARLQIINKFDEGKVKSVQTKQIKEWAASLKELNKDSENYNIFKSLIEDTKNLPEQINEEDLKEQNLYIYKNLIEFK